MPKGERRETLHGSTSCSSSFHSASYYSRITVLGILLLFLTTLFNSAHAITYATFPQAGKYPDAPSAYAACTYKAEKGRSPNPDKAYQIECGPQAGLVDVFQRNTYCLLPYNINWWKCGFSFYWRGANCPGLLIPDSTTNTCVCPEGLVFDENNICVLPFPEIDKRKQQGSPDCKETTKGQGNPCDPSSGNKYESETDFQGAGLSFSRSYNSLNPVDGDLGFGWSGNRYKQLEFSDASNVIVRHADGKGEPFTKSGSDWVGDADTGLILLETSSGFTLDLPDGSSEQYDTNGHLISEINRNGQVTSYAYNTNSELITLNGPYGHAMQFAYDASGHLSSLTDPNGKVVTYSYDAQSNLSTVLYPDGGQRIYHYEDAAFPHHLTGITDENGDRYSTFAYDNDGKAIFTGHAQTDNGDYQEGFTLEYSNGGAQ